MRIRDEEIKMIMRHANKKNGGKGIVNTPQFMGLKGGASIPEVRSWIKKQKRAKGYLHAIGASDTTEFEIDISGSAKIFLGFSLLIGETLAGSPTQFNININEEIMIRETHPFFFSPEFMDDEYYFFPRPLSGSDTVTVTYQNPNAAQTIFMVVYYI